MFCAGSKLPCFELLALVTTGALLLQFPCVVDAKSCSDYVDRGCYQDRCSGSGDTCPSTHVDYEGESGMQKDCNCNFLGYCSKNRDCCCPEAAFECREDGVDKCPNGSIKDGVGTGRCRCRRPQLEVTQLPTPSPCVIDKVSGAWIAIRDGNAAETQVEYSSGLDYTEERSRTKSWSFDVSVTVERGFELFGQDTSVSASIGASSNREYSSLWSQTTSHSETHTVTFDLPGTIFQWQFFIEDSCGRGTVESKSLMLSDSRAHPPCCLPGMFAEPDSPHTKACFPSEDGVTYYTCKGEAPATATLSPTTPRLTAPASNLNIAISDSTSGGSLSRGISGGTNSGDGASSSSGGGSTTVIVIVSVCAGVFLVLGIIGMFLFYNKKRSKATNNLPPELLPTTGGGVPMAPIALGTPCDKI